ncbi:MAG: TIM barrel protein [Candidatus Nanoarchaeia archaeon]
MVKRSYPSTHDQHDPKLFRESLGSLGTTTQPGADQLQQLQAKVRQGVKHVELHLNSSGKGNFGANDTPDKYGFEQRKTIMQLAKMNEQTLSVHASLDLTSFTGLGQGGSFDEAKRWSSLKEVDETLKFAAETAKGGAVVFHMQGEQFSNTRSEPNISKEYLDWLKVNRPEEYKTLKEERLSENLLDRKIVDNPLQEYEVKQDFEKLKTENPEKYQKYQQIGREKGIEPYKAYFTDYTLDKQKISPDVSPYVVVGDKITQVDRNQAFVNVDTLSNPQGFSSQEREILKQAGIEVGNFSINDYQKALALFSNGKPRELYSVDDSTFQNLRKKIVVEYEDVLHKNENLLSLADKEFFQSQMKSQLKQLGLQKQELHTKYEMFSRELKQIRKLEDENKRAILKLQEFENSSKKESIHGAAVDLIKEDISKRNNTIQQLVSVMGYPEYQQLSQYDQAIAQLNKQEYEVKERIGTAKSLTDEVFTKNVSGMGHLGTKALKYQIDLKKKSAIGEEEVKKINKKVEELEKEYDSINDPAKQSQLASEIAKERYKLKRWIGTKDYDDVDIENRPLYLSPENMLPGYGNLSSLDEYKGVIRMAQEDFAKRLLSDESEYEQLRQEYEEVTGKKIQTIEEAQQIAKNHIAGTFDNAHAATWLKHFKKEVNPKTGKEESEEHRIERFNKWMNQEVEKMYKEGIIKHVHFNDSAGKDDDHNLIGQGVLDVHGLRETLRKAGYKEALIVEAGGRGANSNLHLLNAYDAFNVSLFADSNSKAGLHAEDEDGYRIGSTTHHSVVNSGSTQVSDWMSLKREYNRRPEYSEYGMNPSSFSVQPQQGQQVGRWSNTSFF